MSDYRSMWADLGLNLEAHDALLGVLSTVYQDLYLKQPNRPAGMGYFDFVVSEVHGLRVKELVDHRAQGGKVFGAFCVYVPEEIILAAGGICVGLCGGAEISIPAAEEVLPRNLCALIKSSFGFKLAGLCPYIEVCDLVVGETTCDGKKKAWELLGEYVPVYVLETPQRKEERDYQLWFRELQAFKDKVEEVTGRTVEPDALRNAVVLLNHRRAALARLYQARQADPVPISGLDALLIVQLSFFDDPARFTEKLNVLCDELEERVRKGEGVFEKGTPRLMLAGTPMAIPNWKLHALIEGAGATVVCEESCTGTRLITNPTEITANGLEAQIEAIGRRQMEVHCACFTPNEERLDDIIRLARAHRADGVIVHNLLFCQPFNIEGVKVEKALEREGIPALRLETDYSQEDLGQLQTRLEAFLEVIGK